MACHNHFDIKNNGFKPEKKQFFFKKVLVNF